MGNYGLDYNESLKLSLFSKIEVKLEILDTYCTSEVIFEVVSIFNILFLKKIRNQFIIGAVFQTNAVYVCTLCEHGPPNFIVG